MDSDEGARSSRREWRRRLSRKRRRSVRPGKGAEPHRKRADEIIRFAEYRKGQFGGIRDSLTWVRLYHLFRRAQYRAENVPTFRAQRETAERALREAWAFNIRYCSPPLGRAQFEQTVTVGERWYFVSNTELAEQLGITEDEAETAGAESLIPATLRATCRREKLAADERRRQAQTSRRALIRDLIRRGLSNSEIATRAGVHRVTVWRHRSSL